MRANYKLNLPDAAGNPRGAGGYGISPRVCLLPLSTVRAVRGCDAETVFALVDSGQLRWAFDLSARQSGTRELRFFRDEVFGDSEHGATPESVIGKILGDRSAWSRGAIEIGWTISAQAISRLVRSGEIAEANKRLTRASLAAFLKRRLQ